MSYRRQVYLMCDGLETDDDVCPDGDATGEYDAATVAEARLLARGLGWVYRRGRDLCERCETRDRQLR